MHTQTFKHGYSEHVVDCCLKMQELLDITLMLMKNHVHYVVKKKVKDILSSVKRERSNGKKPRHHVGGRKKQTQTFNKVLYGMILKTGIQNGAHSASCLSKYHNGWRILYQRKI